MIIWGSGLVGGLPSIQGGWSWAVASVADPNPDAPAKELQTRMRQQEGLLAEDLCGRLLDHCRRASQLRPES